MLNSDMSVDTAIPILLKRNYYGNTIFNTIITDISYQYTEQFVQFMTYKCNARVRHHIFTNYNCKIRAELFIENSYLCCLLKDALHANSDADTFFSFYNISEKNVLFTDRHFINTILINGNFRMTQIIAEYLITHNLLLTSFNHTNNYTNDSMKCCSLLNETIPLIKFCTSLRGAWITACNTFF